VGDAPGLGRGASGRPADARHEILEHGGLYVQIVSLGHLCIPSPGWQTTFA
jgi:hypothetical protein